MFGSRSKDGDYMDLFMLGLLQKMSRGGGKSVSHSSSYTINNTVDYPIVGLNLYGKSAQNGTPTPDNPVDIVSVGDVGNIQVKSCGENILNPIPVGNAYYNDNGEIVESANFNMYDFIKIDGKTLTLTAKQIRDTEGLRYALFDKDKNFLNRSLFMNIEKTTIRNPNATYIRVFMSNICYEDVRLAFGDVETIKSYCGTSATITSALPLCGIPVESGGNYTDNNGQQWVCDELVYNADGSGKIIKRTKKTTITSDITPEYDGVSTKDSNVHVFDYSYSKLGMTDYKFYNTKYITIEMNMGKMLTKFMARTDASVDSFKYLADGEFGTNTLNADRAYDNYLEIGTSKASTVEEFKALINGCEIVYILATPQEIPLSAAEMIALRQLMTYSSTTNISNSDNADMDVKYCTDKSLSECVLPITMGLQKQIDELQVYMQKQIDELQASILSPGPLTIPGFFAETIIGPIITEGDE